MNKKVKHLCEILGELFFPICTDITIPIIQSISPCAILKINSTSVQMNISLFTIFHLEVNVVGQKNILCTLPPDFDDSELDDIIASLSDYHKNHLAPQFSIENKKKVLLSKKQQIEEELKSLENEN